MSDTSKNKAPIWFWIISVFALIWNSLGVDGYLGQAYNTERYQSSFTVEELEIAASLPSWTMGAFAIAVFAGVAGAIGLLMRKKWSYTFFIISLIAVIAQMGYSILNGHTSNIGMMLSIIIFALFLVWFSKKANSKGWIA
ncbi:MAG: hypothetical protein HKO01_08950 [Flaviramulus sp.]|nr:hypothetical protein [Flaviramulus sp.]NNC50647.1 hypothetical protein [Flaviramulus sp.]